MLVVFLFLLRNYKKYFKAFFTKVHITYTTFCFHAVGNKNKKRIVLIFPIRFNSIPSEGSKPCPHLPNNF